MGFLNGRGTERTGHLWGICVGNEKDMYDYLGGVKNESVQKNWMLLLNRKNQISVLSLL